MPIYEYKCLDCNESFEKLVLKKDELIQCPKCKGNNVERIMSAFAFKSGDNFTPSTGSSSCST
ncbi:MAG: zinc ribbon domain-containing protein [Deltaproteobacteria bacterium]|nr:MAG: zinc ribbon domain-containing protein [Deltaproteobacteria bacterium]